MIKNISRLTIPSGKHGLECTFRGQKVGFKGFGCWVVCFWTGSGLFLLRLRRREYKPGSIKPGVRFGLLGMETVYP